MSFDMDQGIATMYIGNPKNRNVLMEFRVWEPKHM
jgi:hypothetical protein